MDEYPQAKFDALIEHLSTRFPDVADYMAAHFADDALTYLQRITEDERLTSGVKQRKKYLTQQAEAVWQVINQQHEPDMQGLPVVDEMPLLKRHCDMMEMVDSCTLPKGRPSNEHLRELIRKVYAAYGGKKGASIAENSHFEITVKMLLDTIEGAPKDIHKLVVTALKTE